MPHKKTTRVHLAFVGINRSLSFTGESIWSSVIRPIESLGWVNISKSFTFLVPPNNLIENPRSEEHGFVETGLPTLFHGETVRVLQPQHVREKLAKHGLLAQPAFGPWADGGKSWNNFINFLVALEEAYFQNNQLREAEVVIFLRPDVAFGLPALPVKKLIRITKFAVLLRLKFVFLHRRFRHGGLNDRFAVISQKSVRDYFLRIRLVRAHYARHPGDNSEKFLLAVLKEHFVRSSLETDLVRVRLGGVPDLSDLGESNVDSLNLSRPNFE